MASYMFEKTNAAEYDFQLVRKGWIRETKLDVYFTKNHFGRYVLSVSYNGENPSTNMMSIMQASVLVGLLKKLGVSKTDLRNTKFPKDTDSRAIDHLGQIVAILAATVSVKT